MNTGTRIDWITGLKGVACFVVSVNHFLGAYTNFNPLKYKWYCIAYNGSFMVSLFIVISNFLIAKTVAKHPFGGASVGWSVIKRYFRLVLPIVVIFLLVSMLQHMNLYHYWYELLPITESVRKEADYYNYITVYSFGDAIITSLKCVFEVTTKFSFVVWMLPALFYSNMVTFITSISIVGLKRMYAYILLVFAFFLQYHYLGALHATSAIGVAAYLIYSDYVEGVDNKNLGWIVALVSAIVAIWIGTIWPGVEDDGFHAFLTLKNDVLFWYDLGSLAILLTIMFGKNVKRLLSARWVVGFGSISFGYYLLHDCIQCSFGSIVYYHIYCMSERKSITMIFTFVSCFVVTTIGAYLFTKYVEGSVNRMLSLAKKTIYVAH